jgi:hypothetical protein
MAAATDGRLITHPIRLYPSVIPEFRLGAVSRLLLQHGLLDELRMWVHPLILGHGSPRDLLFGPAPSVGFRLAGATTLSHGIIIPN